MVVRRRTWIHEGSRSSKNSISSRSGQIHSVVGFRERGRCLAARGRGASRDHFIPSTHFGVHLHQQQQQKEQVVVVGSARDGDVRVNRSKNRAGVYAEGAARSQVQ